jgi:hypothetical protein
MAGLAWVVVTITFLVIAVVFAARPLEGRPPRKGFTERLGTPSPWAPVGISTLALIAGTTSAIFAGLNYFKAPKARAAIVIERFEDHPISAPMPVHQLSMCLTNSGQSPARLRSVWIVPELQSNFLAAAEENDRMKVAFGHRNLAIPIDAEVNTGQRNCYAAQVGFGDATWDDFRNSNKEKLYVFAFVSFTDELSGESVVITEFCGRLEPSLTNWTYCHKGNNATIRP